MSLISWGESSNIEQSLFDFLNQAISDDSLYVIGNEGNQITPDVRIGYKADQSWILPVIQLYKDSSPSAPFLEIGSSRRDRRHLIIIDVRAENPTQRLDLVDWLVTSIENGFTYYEYTKNADSPSKTQAGYINFDFVSDTRVVADDNADLIDKYRHRISISCWISKS